MEPLHSHPQSATTKSYFLLLPYFPQALIAIKINTHGYPQLQTQSKILFFLAATRLRSKALQANLQLPHRKLISLQLAAFHLQAKVMFGSRRTLTQKEKLAKLTESPSILTTLSLLLLVLSLQGHIKILFSWLTRRLEAKSLIMFILEWIIKLIF